MIFNTSKWEGMIGNLLLASIISTKLKLLNGIINGNPYICSKVSSLDDLVILQKEVVSDLWSIQGAFIGDFVLRKKGKEKKWMAKVVKCYHQVTWAQKSITKMIE